MKKRDIFSLLLALTTSVITVSGCNRIKPSHVDEGIKDAFSYVSEKAEDYSHTMSDSSFNNESKTKMLLSSITKNDETYNALVTDCSVDEYLPDQMFGLYIFYNIDACIRYSFEPNGINYGDKIYGHVTNEMSKDYSDVLKLNNAYTEFYMETDLEENDLIFRVDWKRENNSSKITDTPDYHGCIYVNGRVERDEEGSILSFSVNCFIENYSNFITNSYFDFVNQTVYFYTMNDGNLNGKDAVESLNNGTFTYDDVKNVGFSHLITAVGKIAERVEDVDFIGYEYKGYQSTIVEDKEKEELMREQFATVTAKCSALPLRTSADAMNYSDHKKVDFFDDMLAYGMAKSSLYKTNDGIIMPFYSKNKMIEIIESSLNNETYDENTRQALLNLKGIIESINESKYSLTFSNINGYSLYLPDARSYRLNAYYTSEFFYLLSLPGGNGSLSFSIRNNKIIDVLMREKHTLNEEKWFNSQEDWYEPADIGHGYFIRHTTSHYYHPCMDCEELVEIKTIESTGYVAPIEVSEEELQNDPEYYKEIYSEEYGLYFEGRAEIRHQIYNRNNQTGRMELGGGNEYEYYYDEDIDCFFLTYEAQLECNANTNYIVYPMYQDYYSIEVEENGNQVAIHYTKTSVNNWRHHVFNEVESVTTLTYQDNPKKYTCNIHIDYLNYKDGYFGPGYTMVERYYEQSRTIELTMLDGYREVISRYENSFSSNVYGETEEKYHLSTYTYGDLEVDEYFGSRYSYTVEYIGINNGVTDTGTYTEYLYTDTDNYTEDPQWIASYIIEGYIPGIPEYVNQKIIGQLIKWVNN